MVSVEYTYLIDLVFVLLFNGYSDVADFAFGEVDILDL